LIRGDRDGIEIPSIVEAGLINKSVVLFVGRHLDVGEQAKDTSAAQHIEIGVDHIELVSWREKANQVAVVAHVPVAVEVDPKEQSRYRDGKDC
jgi:hypothetical protein